MQLVLQPVPVGWVSTPRCRGSLASSRYVGSSFSSQPRWRSSVLGYVLLVDRSVGPAVRDNATEFP